MAKCSRRSITYKSHSLSRCQKHINSSLLNVIISLPHLDDKAAVTRFTEFSGLILEAECNSLYAIKIRSIFSVHKNRELLKYVTKTLKAL